MVALAACNSRSGEPPAKREAPATQPDPPVVTSPDAAAALPAHPSTPPVDGGAPRGPGGSVMLTNGMVRNFSVGPGFVYWCEGNIYAAPKSYGIDVSRGPCESAYEFLGDPNGMVFCDAKGIYRLPPGTGGPELIASTDETCLLAAVDAESVYFIIPAFEGVSTPGLYRVPRAGGPVTKLLSHRKGEQATVVVDGDQLWVTSIWDGTIRRMPKAGGKPTLVVTGQRGIVDLVVDSTHLYWFAQGTGEIRRRKKSGGAIEVIGREVDEQGLWIHAGRVYWTQIVPGQTLVPGLKAWKQRLMQWSPDAPAPIEILTDLLVPTVRVDDDGIYFSQLDELGVFMIPHRN